MSELISIIVPIYNAEKYLSTCIKSIINQTYQDLEILLIDDGSMDNSYSICCSFIDKRIKIFKNKNMGLSYTRQFGIDHASGLYFSTIDADDWILPNYVEMLYKTIKNQNSDIAVCNRYDFYGKKKKRIIREYDSSKTLDVNKKKIETNYRNICAICGLSDSWDKMYRMDYVRSTNVKFNLPKEFNGNDLLFNYRLVLHCPSFSFTNEQLLMHRLTRGSLVRSPGKPMVAGFKYIIETIKNESQSLDYGEDFNIELSKVFILFARIIFLYYCENSTSYKTDVVKAFEELRQFFVNSDYLFFDNLKDYSNIDHSIDKAFLSGDINILFKALKEKRIKSFIKRLFNII